MDGCDVVRAKLAVFLHVVPKIDRIRAALAGILQYVPRLDQRGWYLVSNIHVMQDRPAGTPPHRLRSI
jgi:hypothetical protein